MGALTDARKELIEAYGTIMEPMIVDILQDTGTSVVVKKLTDIDTTRGAIEHCTSVTNSRIELDTLYEREDSIMRTQIFEVKITDVKSFVATHLVRHSANGAYWYVESRRDDWNPRDDETGRDAPVNMYAILNAQHLINIARARLCGKAHKETRKVMYMIQDAVAVVDPTLADYLVPDCWYRGGVCHKHEPCGIVHQYPRKEYQ